GLHALARRNDGRHPRRSARRPHGKAPSGGSIPELRRRARSRRHRLDILPKEETMRRVLNYCVAGIATLATVVAVPVPKAGASDDASYKLIFAMDLSPNDAWTQAARFFADTVKEKSDGRIAITVHDSGTLGAQRQALEGILAGVMHGTMATEPLSYWVED